MRKLKPIAFRLKSTRIVFLIKVQDIDQVNKMGFDKANTSEEPTNLYYKNQDAVTNCFINCLTLLQIILYLVWDVDFGHCQKKFPKLVDEYHKLLEKRH